MGKHPNNYINLGLTLYFSWYCFKILGRLNGNCSFLIFVFNVLISVFSHYIKCSLYNYFLFLMISLWSLFNSASAYFPLGPTTCLARVSCLCYQLWFSSPGAGLKTRQKVVGLCLCHYCPRHHPEQSLLRHAGFTPEKDGWLHFTSVSCITS